MNNYLVSCILTTYNRCNLLKRSLDSIINQTYKNIEIFIIDDCSSDSTGEIIKIYNDRSNLGYPGLKIIENLLYHIFHHFQ